MNTELLPGLILILPIIAAAIIRIPWISQRRIAVDSISLAAAGITFVLACWMTSVAVNVPIVHWVGGWELQKEMATGIVLVADGLTSGFIALTAILTTASLLFIVKRYKAREGFLHMFTLLFLGGFNGFVMVGDLLTMFVFVELMGISCYVLTAFKVEDQAPAQAAFNLGVVGTIGTFLFLMGVAMIYKIAGTPNLAEAANRLVNISASPSLALAFSLLLIGLGIKSGFLPFHFAHADSHSVSPAPQAGLFSAILLQAALFVLAKIVYILISTPQINEEIFQNLLVFAGTTTALVAAVMSVCQDHLKRLLAFSSIAHSGIAAAGLGLLNATGITGTGIYVLSHGLAKVALFLVAGLLLHQFQKVFIGSGKKAIPVVLILFIGALVLAGLPPAGLYGGKLLITEAAKEANMMWVMYIIYPAAILTGAAVVRYIFRHYTPGSTNQYPEPLVREQSRETKEQGGYILMTVIPAVLLLASILLPMSPALMEGIARAAEYDFNRDRYINMILSGEVADSIHTYTYDLWEPRELTKGVLSSACAILLGALAAWYPTFGSYTSGPLRFLRKLHSGHVGDYVVWVILGMITTAGYILVQFAMV